MSKPLPIIAGVAIASLSLSGAFAASAVQKECSAKYQAAKAANTLNGQKYKDFYKQCSAETKAEKAGAPAPAPAAAPASAPAAPAPTTASRTPASPPAASVPPASPAPAATASRAPAAPAGSAVFPTAISPQYKSLSAGIARRKTCDDQYKINKTTNGNGGLKWIEKGGGYYSECNTRLKS